MYFSEHNPPHFHAIYGKFEAEILVEAGTILKRKTPSQGLYSCERVDSKIQGPVNSGLGTGKKT